LTNKKLYKHKFKE